VGRDHVLEAADEYKDLALLCKAKKFMWLSVSECPAPHKFLHISRQSRGHTLSDLRIKFTSGLLREKIRDV
jgi:hypothetical protein